MKKLIATLLFLIIASPAFAAWEITASWTASSGPNLAHETLVVDNTVIATLQAGEQTAHVFTRDELNGEVVKVISYNEAGVPNAGYVIGTLEAIQAPADASGGSIIIRWKP